MLKKLLHEPLVHFLVLGGLLFFSYSFFTENEDTQNHIVISKERIVQLTSQKEKELLRLLSKEEKEEIIEKEIYEEVLYKEALKIGLNNNDVDIKKHLVKKMEFVTYNTYELPVPSDEALKAFMLENRKNYLKEERVHFIQSMIGTNVKHFKKEYDLTAFEVSNIFGRSFSEVIFELETDEKVHKVESTYGVHEVQVIEKITGEVKDFNVVKEKVLDDYLRKQREQKNNVIYEALKSQYRISIEK